MPAATREQTGTNGAPQLRVGSFAAAGAPYDDPMSKVLGLDAKTSGLAAWLGFTSGGTLLFAGLTALVLVVAWWHTLQLHRTASTTEEIEILRDETPPPPPPPPTAEVKPEAPAARPLSREAPPPPPPPAQAAKVLTQESKPDEPVDLTGNTIVQGNADAFAGGFTTATGTGTAAARTAPGPSAAPGGGGPATGAPQAAAPPGPDLSRSASLGGGSEWSCPFPQEADTAQIDEAWVTLQVDVKADGSPATVRVLGDPGNGFGREARRCALGKRYSTALDPKGTPIAGTTKAFRVHFSR
jgi:protein TonB